MRISTKQKSLGIALALILGLCLVTACAAGSPQSLARETFEIARDSAAGILDKEKLEDLEKRANKLRDQVSALSDADREKYVQELLGIAGQGISGAFESAGRAIESAANSEAAVNAKNAVNDLLNRAAEQVERVSREDVEQALRDAATAAGNAAQSAADALKALGK